jgi:hypothetical protein
VETYSVSLILDGTWDYDRFRRGTEPNDMKLQTHTSLDFRGGWRGTVFTFVESFKYPAALYANHYVERRDASGAVLDTVPYTGTDRLPNYGGMVTVATPQFQRFSGSAQLIGGHDDNFDEWSSAWILFATLNLEWRPSERLRVNGRYVEQRFHRVSDGSLVRLRMIPRARVEYQARPLRLLPLRRPVRRGEGRFAARRLAHQRSHPDPSTGRQLPARGGPGAFGVPVGRPLLVPAQSGHGGVRRLRQHHGGPRVLRAAGDGAHGGRVLREGQLPVAALTGSMGSCAAWAR